MHTQIQVQHKHIHTHTPESQGPKAVCTPGGKQLIKLTDNEHSKIITDNTQTHI